MERSRVRQQFRAVHAGAVTYHGLGDTVTKAVEGAFGSRLAQLTDLVNSFQKINQPVLTTAVQPTPTIEEDLASYAYVWGDKSHNLPQDFKFPSGGPLVAWQHYCCGNPAQGHPPLRLVVPSDIAQPNVRKQLSDYKFLMKMIEARVRAAGKWIAPASMEQANDMFECGKDAIAIPDASDKDRKRRKCQLQWTTHVKLVRSERKCIGTVTEGITSEIF